MISSLHVIDANKEYIQQACYQLVQALAENGHPTQIIVPPHLKTDLLDPPIPTHFVKMRSAYDFPSRWKISALIKKIQPDIVHTWSERCTRLTHCAINTTTHVSRLDDFHDLRHYRHAHTWIGNTIAVQGYLQENQISPDKIFHINDIIPGPALTDKSIINAWKVKSGIPDNSLCLVAIGKLNPNQGFDILINAFKKLPLEIEGRPLHLVIIGDGPLAKELKILSAELMSHQNHIHWPGWQENPYACLAAADLFICSARHNPHGTEIAQAWNYGIPVIATATHGAQELITAGLNGIITSIDDTSELTLAIIKALTLPQKTLATMIESASKTLLNHYGTSVILKQTLECYKKLIH